VLVLLIWAVALGLSLVILAVLGYGLFGQLKRLRRAVEEAGAEIQPRLLALRPDQPAGRHRAP
jgi:hypothetical protein